MSKRRHIHLGLGRFHRAHQAVYLQNAGYDITAFSMRSPRAALALAEVGHKYELEVCGQGQTASQTITSIDEALFIADHEARFLELMADPDVTTLTLTITEKGYSPDGPTLNYLAKGILARQSQHSQPLHLLSCDNLNGNGDLLARLLRDGSSDEQGKIDFSLLSFPNTMVDRIVPAGDSTTIKTEAFHQWVIEDRFQGERPQWEQEGLMFAPSVEPFEKIKLSLLNASHSFLAYYGQLQGHIFVHEAIADSEILSLVCKLYFEEVGPLLVMPSPLRLESYGEALLARFNNPGLPHRLDQIAMDGSVKIPQRFLPFLKVSSVLQLALESWFEYMWLSLRGERDFRVSDPKAQQMRALVSQGRGETEAAWKDLLGWDL